MKRFKVIGLALLTLAGSLTACAAYVPSVDEQDQSKQERQQQNLTKEIGLPNIVNFTEKKEMKHIMELRDRADLATYAYTQALDGHFIPLFRSLGFGLPYATQYTNPMKVVNPYASEYTTLPQNDPNGLFMPTAAEGTWLEAVTCKGRTVVVYVEPRVLVSQVALPGVPRPTCIPD